MCKSTNVSGSIAGYYYQILLACKELTYDIYKVKEVGIETDADVRVVNYNNEKQSIEAKFHKSNMNRYDKDIIKTIYNFYKYSSGDKKLTLSTNVTLTKKEDMEFFDKWKLGRLGEDEKVAYVKKCILRHCKFSVKTYKESYEEYKKDIDNLNGNKKEAYKEPYYINKLEGDIFKNGFNEKLYKNYAYVNEDVDYNAFIKKLNFEFGDNSSKLKTILELKAEIKSNLQKICKQKEKNIEENDYEKIINLIIDKFFEIIVINSDLEEKQNFDNMKKFSTIDLIKCIDTYKEQELKYLSKEKIKNIIDQVDEDERIFNNLITENKNLTQAKKQELNQTHNLIKQELLRKITDKDFFENFTKTYTLSSNNYSNDIIYKLTFHLTIICVYENKKIENINFLKYNNSIENIFIKDLIKYVYKVCPSEYKSISIDFKRLLQELKEKYGISYINKLNRDLIVVFNGEFSRNSRPCEKKVSEVLSFLDDIAIADEDMIYKYQLLYKNIDCRCDNCISIDIYDTENKIKSNLQNFFNCKEEKKKNGVYGAYKK